MAAQAMLLVIGVLVNFKSECGLRHTNVHTACRQPSKRTRLRPFPAVSASWSGYSRANVEPVRTNGAHVPHKYSTAISAAHKEN
jgi:hypothetical protein